ncbi:thioredoxin domain-containing protein [Patescibacteria group bacterium]|nr:thioredoxin domain-containing protein [Patescibacteria group bacterium]
MEIKKETEEKTSANLKKKKNSLCKSKNFPLGFSFGFFTMGLITVALISLILVPLVKKDEEADTSLGLEKAKTKIESFINEVLIKNDDKVTIKKAYEESDLYKIIITTSTGQDVETYVTKDGKLFFDRVMDIEEITKENQEASAEVPQNQEIAKNDKPVVELFVMSHCPYGTQIEKGILPVLETLRDKIDFELKFCDYAMHSKKELDEQLRQHCIKTEEPAKFISYLQCFLEADRSDECLKTSNINISKLNACVSATDKKYKVTENFNNKDTWKGNYPTFNINKEDVDKYNIGGSPALIINGTTVNSSRDPKSLLTTICSAFETPPEECSAELSSDTPSPGFGFGTTNSGDSASCN